MKLDRRKFITAAAIAISGCGGSSWWEDVHIPMPEVLRTDLNYCYYLSLPGQMGKTADHTSLLWHGQFYSLDALEVELQGHDQRMVLDCALQLVHRASNGRALSPTAEPDLRAFFTDMRARGLLSRVAYLTPMDEPNLFAASESDVVQSMAVLKRVAAEFQELAGVKYICIYGENAERLWALPEFDVVGIDNYKQRSSVLTTGAHADLMRHLLPHQQVMVLPGAAYGQDPTPFVAYAHSEPRCWGVVPFIWCHVPESADKEGWKGLEKQDAAAQERYRSAGLLTLNRSTI